ncbi:MAG: RIP metalloprotease RseP [Prevotella sp.]|jgi:regulator of sigma E protease
MEIFLIRLLQFILSISLLVLLHEGGHAFFSKLFGVRVEKFFIFFDVGIGKWNGALFSFKPKSSDTTYGMGWLPLGGYCKIAGMIDESLDTEQMKKPAQPWEFRTKPAWQRLLIMVGGVLVNFLLALFIYSMIMFHWGEEYIRVADMSMGMKFNTEAKQLGFKDHDILVGTDKRPFKDFNLDVYQDISNAKYVDIIRDGKKMRINLPGSINLLDMLKTTPQFVRPYLPAVVDTVFREMPVSEDSKEMIVTPAWKAGLKKGDRILSFNGNRIDSYNDFTLEVTKLSDRLSAVENHRDSLKLRHINITVQRAGTQHVDTISTLLTPDLKLGYVNQDIYSLYGNKITKVNYSFLASFPAGVKYGWNVLAGYVDQMKYVFTPEGVKGLGGFGAIGSLFPAKWNWYMFWRMTAFLSIILAFMNILPIPALDGGHVLFLLYEIITRRKPSDNFMIKAEYVGFIILILLMVVANLNDVLRWLGVM